LNPTLDVLVEEARALAASVAVARARKMPGTSLLEECCRLTLARLVRGHPRRARLRGDVVEVDGFGEVGRLSASEAAALGLPGRLE